MLHIDLFPSIIKASEVWHGRWIERPRTSNGWCCCASISGHLVEIHITRLCNPSALGGKGIIIYYVYIVQDRKTDPEGINLYVPDLRDGNW